MPQNSNFPIPRGHRFWPKFDFTVMAPNHGGDPLGSFLGPMGAHWVQKMGQNCKKFLCPKIRIFDYPAVMDFCQNSTLLLRRQITVGTPWGPSWGQWGPIGSKKWVKTVKNYHAPKFEFSITPQSSISTKIRLYCFGAKSPMGSHTVHLGANRGHWVKKWVKTVKNYHAPKFEFSTTPPSLILAKIRIYGYGAKSLWGHSWVHLGANGVPLVPKNGSKP